MSTSLMMFLIFIAITLGITWRAARQSSGASAYFAAERATTCRPRHSWALPASLRFRVTTLYVMYSVGFLVAFLTVLLIVAEPLRNADKYTMADILAYRLSPQPVRAMAAISSGYLNDGLRGLRRYARHNMGANRED